MAPAIAQIPTFAARHQGRASTQPRAVPQKRIQLPARTAANAGKPTHSRAASLIVKSSARLVVAAAAEASQLGTAKLPADCDIPTLGNSLYQWASTITSSGQNMPFALPQKVDKTATGFKMSFLMQNQLGAFDSVGEIEAAVEKARSESPGAGAAEQSALTAATKQFTVVVSLPTLQQPDGTPVLFIRGFGKVVDKTLVDVPIVMELMPNAIRQAVISSRPKPPAK